MFSTRVLKYTGVVVGCCPESAGLGEIHWSRSQTVAPALVNSLWFDFQTVVNIEPRLTVCLAVHNHWCCGDCRLDLVHLRKKNVLYCKHDVAGMYYDFQRNF